MGKNFLVGLCGLFALASPVVGQEGVRADRILGARDLHRHCASSEATEAGRLSIGYCLGAITGIADATMTMNAVLAGRQTICLSEENDAEALRLSFLIFIERVPDAADLPAATAVIAALQTNFPCEDAQ